MRFFTYAICVVAVTGCGEISYKRGATAQDYAQAEQACKDQGAGKSLCMQAHGWKQADFAAQNPDPLFATITTTDNRSQGFNQSSPQPLDAMATPINLPKTEKDLPRLNTQPLTESTLASSSKSVREAEHDTRMDGLDVEYVINSWWKRGAFPPQLQTDQQKCQVYLGENYLPDYKHSRFKRKFVFCMHELGWTAIRNVK